MKQIIIAVIIIAVVAVGGYALLNYFKGEMEAVNPTPETPVEVATTTPVVEQPVNTKETVLGKSVEGNDIIAYHFGSSTSTKEVLFVGGVHGGYSPNTSLVLFELMDYLDKTPAFIPAGVKVTIVPVMNPDGLKKITGTTGRFTAADIKGTDEAKVAARFNANTVDLNRNFDCEWNTTSKWQNRTVSGGTAVFSEPEAQAIKKYVESHNLSAAVVWYSAAGGVFASNCRNGVSAETKALTDVYAKASGYRGYQSFDFYEITGDMVNWFAKKEIPAISVLLTNHKDTDWTKNRSGIEALLKHVAKPAAASTTN